MNDSELRDLENRYLMDELTPEDRAHMDARRRADPDVDRRLAALEGMAALLTLLDPEEVDPDDGWALPPLAGLKVDPLRLDDGGLARAPDEVRVPGCPGRRAGELVAEAKAAGFVRVRPAARAPQFLLRPGHPPVVFPFPDRAWLGPQVVSRYRALLGGVTDTLRVEREVDGRWFAEVATLPGALAYGATRRDARARVLRLTQRVLRRGHPAFRNRTEPAVEV